jgi:hypothetical protein
MLRVTILIGVVIGILVHSSVSQRGCIVSVAEVITLRL